jgi:cation diffusion facilitator CzcD-associated flavoprotein CzcO
MAATGSFLREAEHRMPVLLIGGGCTGLAVVAGLAQLP